MRQSRRILIPHKHWQHEPQTPPAWFMLSRVNLVPWHAESTKAGMWANTKIFKTITSISTELGTFLYSRLSVSVCCQSQWIHKTMEGHVRLNIATKCVWKQESVADAIVGHPWVIFPCVNVATWPTYCVELQQPLRVQIVHRDKLSHGTHDAHFPSAPSLLHSASNPLHPVPTKPPPPSPGQEDYFNSSSSWGRAAALLWSAHQLCRTIHELCVWVLLKYCSTYIMKSTLLSLEALPKEGSVCF